MGDIDIDAIANAIVTLYSTVTPPSGQPSLTDVTADLPDAISNERTLLVFPPEEPEWAQGPSFRKTTLLIPIRFYLWKVRDNPRTTRLLRNWNTVLYSQFDASVHLGLADYVHWARIVSGPGTSRITYAGTEYSGLTYMAGVRVSEPVLATA